jgi:hypothetical protein
MWAPTCAGCSSPSGCTGSTCGSPAATIAAAAAHFAAGFPWLWLLPALGAVADLFWIPNRLVAVNKEIRMQTMLGSAQRGAPRGFRGHFTDDNATGDESNGQDKGQ